MRTTLAKLRSPKRRRLAIGVSLAIALCTACTPYQQLLFSLVPDGTIPTLLSHFERVDDTNRRRVLEFEQRKDWDGLAKFAEEHLKEEKSNSDWWTIAGYAYSQAGNYKRAVECYGEAVRLTPDDMVAWNLLVQSYRSAGQPERALQIANRALNIKSDSPQTWYLVGELNGDLGRYVPAANAYGESIKLDEGFAPAWLGLGKVYVRLGRTAELKKVTETLQQLDPALARELAAFKPK